MTRTRPGLHAPLAGILFLLVAPEASAATDYQRYITFQNDFKFPIYPVIQVPESNCVAGSPRDRRIIVNGNGHSGLVAGEMVTVLLPPKDLGPVLPVINPAPASQAAASAIATAGQPSVNCWYGSGRVYIFSVDILTYEKNLTSMGQGTLATQLNDSTFPSKSVPCTVGNRDNPGASGQCYTGVSGGSYPLDSPAQLVEYTFDSDFALPNPPAGTPPADTGRPMADIDLSYVDDLYLPIAASIYNHGATGYMGSAMPLTTFKTNVDNFRRLNPKSSVRRWPMDRAYTPRFWASNAFSSAIPAQLGPPNIAEHLPSGAQMFTLANTAGLSAIYTVPKGSPPSFMISAEQVSTTAGPPPQSTPSNASMQQYVDRWMAWVSGKYSSCNLSQFKSTDWPEGVTASFQNAHFCQLFQQNVQTVFNHFMSDSTDGYNSNVQRFRDECGYTALNAPSDDQNLINACVIQHIVAYNSKVNSGELPGQVQAALRGVAYDPVDGNQQYQFDPFLTFKVPYDSPFNLIPYTRLVHSTTDGIGAVAYSFSIDDKYGNFRDEATGFVIDAGGISALENQNPYDPYQQYKAAWAYNPDTYSLAKVATGINLPQDQTQLENIATTYGSNHPIVIQQGDNLSVLGRAANGDWILNVVTDLAQLQYLAQQESIQSNNQQHTYQDLIDHTFGSSTVFPSAYLDPDNYQPNTLGILDWNVDTGWNDGKLRLYELIAQDNANTISTNNWTAATICGRTTQITGAGNLSIPFQYANTDLKLVHTYGKAAKRLRTKLARKKTLPTPSPCTITLEDGQNRKLALNLGPVAYSVVDQYTGATQQVLGLTHSPNASPGNPVSNPLDSASIDYCRANSDMELVLLNFCDQMITVSATWSADPLARDTVYMGLLDQDKPRVNLNLPAATINGLPAENAYFPVGAAMTTVSNDGTTAKIQWTPAFIKSGKPAAYILYVAGNPATPLTYCQQDQNPIDPNGPKINLQTGCSVSLGNGIGAGTPLYVLALNFEVQPPPAQAQLNGTIGPQTGAGR